MKTDKTNNSKMLHVNQYDMTQPLVIPDTTGDTYAVREIKHAVALADWLDASGLIEVVTRKDSQYVWINLNPRKDGVGATTLATIDLFKRGYDANDVSVNTLRAIALTLIDPLNTDAAKIVAGMGLEIAIAVVIGRTFDRLARGAE